MLDIPMFQEESTDFEFSIDLDNITTTIRLTYNVRSGYFRMNISTENYSLYGLKVVAEFPLIYQHKALFPELPGDIIINQVNRLDEEIDMTYDNLGSDYVMRYYTKDEFEAWKT